MIQKIIEQNQKKSYNTLIKTNSQEITIESTDQVIIKKNTITIKENKLILLIIPTNKIEYIKTIK